MVAPGLRNQRIIAMLYREGDAVRRLVSLSAAEDTQASSHWAHYHRNFLASPDGTITGIEGFGGFSPPFGLFAGMAHRLFQSRYRRMAAGSDFKRIDAVAARMTAMQGKAYDLDVLRQSLTAAFLASRLGAPWPLVAVIGDGFASLTTLLLASGLAQQVVLVNLNRTLLVDAVYFRKCEQLEAGMTMCLAENSADLNFALSSGTRCILLPAAAHEALRAAPFDLFINIASMQEMDPAVTAGYFADMRHTASSKKTFFYCCNREQKVLPDGTKSIFAEYPWSSADEILVDELCPWHQEYYELRPPFYRHYDGPHQHRLVRLVST